MNKEGRVYKLCPRDGAGPEKNLNRLELRVLPTAITSMPMTQTQPLPDPGLTSDPPRESNSNTADDDSDAEGITLAMEPERQKVKTRATSARPSQVPSAANKQVVQGVFRGAVAF